MINRINLIALILAMTMFSYPGVITGQDADESKSDLKTLKQKASYLVGFDIGQDVLRRELDVDHKLLVRGLMDALSKKTPPMSKSEMAAVMKDFEKQVRQQANAKWAAMAQSNMEKGIAYLNKNKLTDGVIQLESGLQYKQLKSTKGDSPKNGERVKVNVVGKHLDGEIFENTLQSKMPIEITVGTTLRGLDEALRRMSVGSKWLVTIPSELAFGQRGSPPVIGPNETLIYEIELVELLPKGKLPK